MCMLNRCHLAARIIVKKMEPILDLLVFEDCAFLPQLSREACSVVQL